MAPDTDRRAWASWSRCRRSGSGGPSRWRPRARPGLLAAAGGPRGRRPNAAREDPNPAAAVAFGLALVPFVFLALAVMSEHPSVPGAVLRAMGWPSWSGPIVSGVVGDAVTGVVAGLGAGGIVALRMDARQNYRARVWAVVFAAAYTAFLVAVTGAMVLFPAPIFPFTAHRHRRPPRRAARPSEGRRQSGVVGLSGLGLGPTVDTSARRSGAVPARSSGRPPPGGGASPSSCSSSSRGHLGRGPRSAGGPWSVRGGPRGPARCRRTRPPATSSGTRRPAAQGVEGAQGHEVGARRTGRRGRGGGRGAGGRPLAAGRVKAASRRRARWGGPPGLARALCQPSSRSAPAAMSAGPATVPITCGGRTPAGG